MSELVKIKLHLSHGQFLKLKRGKTVQLSHGQLERGEPHHLMVHEHKAKKIHHAVKNRKGVRLSLSEPELHYTIESGGFLDWIKNAGRFIKDKIIDTDFYQQNIKPIARNLVNTGLAAAAPTLGIATPAAKAAVDAIGSQTGAFGLKPHKKSKPREHRSEMTKFVVESMMQPGVNQPGFTALPAPATGDGIHGKHSQIHYHHYYYPHDHMHVGGRGGRYPKVQAGSFRMA